MSDGSMPNTVIQKMVKNGYPWKGPVLVVKQKGQDSTLDVYCDLNLKDIRNIVAFFETKTSRAWSGVPGVNQHDYKLNARKCMKVMEKNFNEGKSDGLIWSKQKIFWSAKHGRQDLK